MRPGEKEKGERASPADWEKGGEGVAARGELASVHGGFLDVRAGDRRAIGGWFGRRRRHSGRRLEGAAAGWSSHHG